MASDAGVTDLELRLRAAFHDGLGRIQTELPPRLAGNLGTFRKRLRALEGRGDRARAESRRRLKALGDGVRRRIAAGLRGLRLRIQ